MKALTKWRFSQVYISFGEQIVSSDKTLVYLTIERVADRHYGNYSLRAGNMVGSDMTTVTLSRTVGDKSSGDSARGRQQQRDAHAVAADDADHFRSHPAPSGGHRQG